jgi:hypothetical protein
MIQRHMTKTAKQYRLIRHRVIIKRQGWKIISYNISTGVATSANKQGEIRIINPTRYLSWDAIIPNPFGPHTL